MSCRRSWQSRVRAVKENPTGLVSRTTGFHLEYIAAVTRLGSLRRAAEELRLPQPALSETVRNPER